MLVHKNKQEEEECLQNDSIYSAETISFFSPSVFVENYILLNDRVRVRVC